MSRARVSVRQLADEADIDVDEAIVLLWDAGITSVWDEGDSVPRNSNSAARNALGLHRVKELRSIEYLAGAAGVSMEVAREKLVAAHLVSPIVDHVPRRILTRASKLLGVDAAEVRAYCAAINPDQGVNTRSPNHPCFHQARTVEWRTVGRPGRVDVLSEEDVLRIHYALVKDFASSRDPIEPPGVKNENLLSSAMHRPLTSHGEDLKYPTPVMASAALFHSLTLNHAFHNGNKRTAVVSLLVMLERNNIVLEVSQPDLFYTVLQLARHKTVDVAGFRSSDLADAELLAVADWIEANSRVVRRDDMPLKWHELRSVLAAFGCESKPIHGNKIEITRRVPRSRFFGVQRQATLRSAPSYAGEGREVTVNAVRRIRKDLQLDEEHGYDSDVFYRSRPKIDDFIATYRKTLNRLARL